MKTYLICFFALLLAACSGEVKNDAKVVEKLDATKIKFIVDTTKQVVDTIQLNKTDTAFVVKNKLIKDDIGDKQKDYQIDIYFSNKNFPKLNHKNAIGADLFLTEDLDGDGKQEILLRPEWFSSCWASINLYSIKNGNWKLIKQGSMYFCSDEYPLSKRVIKTEKGYGLLTDSLAEDRFITLKKEIKF